MARPLRIERAGGWFHITGRGNERRACGLKLEELAAGAGMTDYSTVSIAVRRFEKRLLKSQAEQNRLKQVCQLLNVEM